MLTQLPSSYEFRQPFRLTVSWTLSIIECVECRSQILWSSTV